MRFVRSITTGAMALAAVVGLGLSAHADTDTARQQAAAAQAASFEGYQIVTLPNANVPNFTRRYVYCPTGKRVVGGGGEAQGNEAILVGSFPTADGKGWIVLGRQTNYSSVGISAYAICATVS